MKIFSVVTQYKNYKDIKESHGDFVSKETAQIFINEQENPNQFWIEENEMNPLHILRVDKNGWICPMDDDEMEDEECINEKEFVAVLIHDIHTKMGI